MSVITMPALVVQTIAGFDYGQVRYELEDRSDITGGAFVLLQGPPRWRFGIRSWQALTLQQAGQWESMLLKLRGGINHLAVYDVLRPAPVGTARGAPLLGAAAALGASSITLDNVIGTYEAGDWLQIGTGLGTSQTVKVTDAVASAVASTGAFTWTNGVGGFTWTNGGAFTWNKPGATVTVNFEPPLRQAFPRWAVVGWDKPLTYCKATNSATSWQARPGGPYIEGFSLDLVEQWS